MKKYPLISEQLNSIKNGEPSFLGMDGGNIDSEFWLCGVEFGSDLSVMEKYYKKTVRSYSKNGWEVPYRDQCPSEFMNSSFDRRLAYFYSTLFIKNEQPTKNEIDEILNDNLYNQNSKIFKLNLYPLSKPDLSWDKEIEEYLEISKEEYYDSIFKNRISFIKELVKTYSSRTVICFAPTNFSELYIDVFFKDNENLNYIKDQTTLKNNREAKIKVISNQHIKLIIVPFLGRGNLISYDDVMLVAKYLKSKYLG